MITSTNTSYNPECYKTKISSPISQMENSSKVVHQYTTEQLSYPIHIKYYMALSDLEDLF